MFFCFVFFFIRREKLEPENESNGIIGSGLWIIPFAALGEWVTGLINDSDHWSLSSSEQMLVGKKDQAAVI